MRALMAFVFWLFLATSSLAASLDGQQCVMINCHGLEMACGWVKGPQSCDARYALGDFCREYAACQIMDGACQLVKQDKFDACAGCLEQCAKGSDKKYSWECHTQCQAYMNGVAAR